MKAKGIKVKVKEKLQVWGVKVRVKVRVSKEGQGKGPGSGLGIGWVVRVTFVFRASARRQWVQVIVPIGKVPGLEMTIIPVYIMLRYP